MGREAVDKFYSDHNHTYVPGRGDRGGVHRVGIESVQQKSVRSAAFGEGQSGAGG